MLFTLCSMLYAPCALPSIPISLEPLVYLRSALCSMRHASVALRHALCPLPYALLLCRQRSVPFALCSLRYAPCPMLYALCSLRFALFPLTNQKFKSTFTHIREVSFTCKGGRNAYPLQCLPREMQIRFHWGGIFPIPLGLYAPCFLLHWRSFCPFLFPLYSLLFTLCPMPSAPCPLPSAPCLPFYWGPAIL